MTEIIKKDAAYKVAEKYIKGEINDFPRKVGKYSLVSVDGIGGATYADKKGKKEYVFLTKDVLIKTAKGMMAEGLIPDYQDPWWVVTSISYDWVPGKLAYNHAREIERRRSEEAEWRTQLRREK